MVDNRWLPPPGASPPQLHTWAQEHAGLHRRLGNPAELVPWGIVVKSSDESTNTDTTLSNDAELQFYMEATARYVFRGTIFFDTVAAADFKWRHTGPASPTLVRILRRSLIPGGTEADLDVAVDTAYLAADVTLTGAGTTGGCVELNGIIYNGANAGLFAFQWAQNTSDGSNTTVRAGSYLEWRS